MEGRQGCCWSWRKTPNPQVRALEGFQEEVMSKLKTENVSQTRGFGVGAGRVIQTQEAMCAKRQQAC